MFVLECALEFAPEFNLEFVLECVLELVLEFALEFILECVPCMCSVLIPPLHCIHISHNALEDDCVLS